MVKVQQEKKKNKIRYKHSKMSKQGASWVQVSLNLYLTQLVSINININEKISYFDYVLEINLDF